LSVGAEREEMGKGERGKEKKGEYDYICIHDVKRSFWGYL
jgi:hypothetical protein